MTVPVTEGSKVISVGDAASPLPPLPASDSAWRSDPTPASAVVSTVSGEVSTSTAPTSQPEPCGLDTPRWSVVIAAGEPA